MEGVIGYLNVSKRDFVNSLAPCDERPENVRGERWTLPLQGSLKINTDAASKNGDAAIAMVVRDFLGEILHLQSFFCEHFVSNGGRALSTSLDSLFS